LVAESRFQLVDRSDATELFRPDRDYGVQAAFAVWDDRLRAVVAVTNGARQSQNDNIDFAYSARVVCEPLGPLAPGEGDAEWSDTLMVAIGASFLYDLVPTDAASLGLPADIDGDGRIDNVGVWQAGAEIAGRWHGASIAAEVFHRTLDYGGAETATRKSTVGTYAQAGYFLVPRRLELAARYSFAQPSGFGLDATTRAALGTEHHEATFGSSYLLFGRDVKAQLEYSYLVDTDVPENGHRDRASHRIRAQIQLAF
jgi:hypothetical protein